MCSRIRIGANQHSMGAVLSIGLANMKMASMSWGIKWGFDSLVNLRSEKLHTTWNDISENRCIIAVDGFYEKGQEFVLRDNEKLLLGGLYNKDRTEFALLTMEAEGMIKSIHHRQPIIVNDFADYFLLEENPDFAKFVYPLRA